jgi:hypothetical protein
MFELKIDTSAFERQARAISGGIDQLGYALSRAMNVAVKDARTVLVQQTWPKSVTVRNKSFLSAALRMEFATKGNLSVAITDAGLPGRAHLALHADGGTKVAKGRLAIPTNAVRKGASGVVASQLPAVLKRKVVKGGLIFQAYGRGKNSHLRLMYKLQSSATQPADVPFRSDFADAILNGVRTSFPEAFRRALATAR